MTTFEEKLREALAKKFGENAKPWLDEKLIVVGPDTKEEDKDDRQG